MGEERFCICTTKTTGRRFLVRLTPRDDDRYYASYRWAGSTRIVPGWSPTLGQLEGFSPEWVGASAWTLAVLKGCWDG